MIVNFNELQKIRLKHQNQKIALCHGVFNYLHAGHILHLKWAKEKADILVVSVTGNDHVDNKRDRFCLPESQRVNLINTLTFVDYIVVSNFSSAVEVLQNLKPDFYVKGSEYLAGITATLQQEASCTNLIFSDTPKLTSSSELISEITEAIDIYSDAERIDCILYCLARYKFVARLLHPSESVLDVGCGYGYGTKFLSKYCAKAIGCDINAICVEAAKIRFPDIQFFHTDIREVNLGQFDVVTCMELIEHLENPDEVIEKVKKTTRKYAVFSTPRYVPYENRSEVRKLFHVKEYDKESLYNLLSKFFNTVLIFTQTDEVITSGNPDVCWTYIAICL